MYVYRVYIQPTWLLHGYIDLLSFTFLGYIGHLPLLASASLADSWDIASCSVYFCSLSLGSSRCPAAMKQTETRGECVSLSQAVSSTGGVSAGRNPPPLPPLTCISISLGIHLPSICDLLSPRVSRCLSSSCCFLSFVMLPLSSPLSYVRASIEVQGDIRVVDAGDSPLEI